MHTFTGDLCRGELPVAKSIYQAAGCCGNADATIESLKTSDQIDVDFSLKVSNLTVFGNGTGEMNFQAHGALTVMIARPLFGMFTLPITNFSRFFEIPGDDTFETDGPTTILQHSQGAYVFKMTNFTISSRTDCDDCGYNISVTYSTVGTLLEQSKCKTLGCPPIDEKLMMPTTNLTIADAYLFIDSVKAPRVTAAQAGTEDYSGAQIEEISRYAAAHYTQKLANYNAKYNYTKPLWMLEVMILEQLFVRPSHIKFM